MMDVRARDENRPGARWLLLSGAWLGACLVGLGLVTAHSLTQGMAADPPRSWLEDAGLAKRSDGPTLIVFGHPRCPCVWATFRWLGEVVAATHAPPDVFVVFTIPRAAKEDWQASEIARYAQSLDGVQVVWDDDGQIARRFDAHTSGQVLFYDAWGELAFVGGVTGARGHEGSNAGADAVVALLNGQEPRAIATPVYGCELVVSPKDRAATRGDEPIDGETSDCCRDCRVASKGRR